MDRQKEERERGVTISCTTKEFFTDKFHYTIIDAPGARVGTAHAAHERARSRQAAGHGIQQGTALVAAVAWHSALDGRREARLCSRRFAHPHLLPARRPQATGISSRT